MFDLTIERRQPIVNQTAFIDRIGPRAQLYDDLVISDPMTASSQTKPQPKTDRGERTRQKILAAAGSEIGKRGFSVTSISDITAAAGVGGVTTTCGCDDTGCEAIGCVYSSGLFTGIAPLGRSVDSDGNVAG